MVLMGRYPHLGPFELERPADLEIARDALRATGTEALESRTFATLSGGEKQRVIIATALAQASDILLLDEPTTALDLGYQFEIAALLKRLNAEHGTTMVVSTHDLNLAAALCERVVLLKSGSVIAHGPTTETLTAGNIRRALRHRGGCAISSPRRSSDGRAARSNMTHAVAADRPRPAVRVRLAWTLASFGTLALLAILLGAARRQHANPSVDRVRSIAAVRGQHRRPDLLRGASAARARRRAGRQQPRARRRRVPGAAPQSARVARHARRLGRSVARRDDRDYIQPGFFAARCDRRSDGQLRRIIRGARHRLRLVRGETPWHVDDGAAARRRDRSGAARPRSSPSCSTWRISRRHSETCAG